MDHKFGESVRELVLTLRDGLVRTAFWKVPGYKRSTLYLQAVVVVAGMCIFQFYPLVPGVSIGLLGVVAILMTLVDLSKSEKVVWLVFVFLLFIMEMSTIINERYKYDADQAAIRAAEDKARKEERVSFATLLEQGHALFENEKALSKQDRDQITGGDSYIVVVPILLSIEGPNTFALLAFIGKNGSRYGVPDATINIRQLPIPNEGKISSFQTLLAGRRNPEDATIVVNAVDPDWSQLLPKRITPSLSGISDYVVNVYAKNKPTTETFHVRWNVQTKAWEYSYKVIREVVPGGPNKPGKYKTLEVTKPEWQTFTFVESKQ